MSRKPFKVGQRVWSALEGWGRILRIDSDDEHYPVMCVFDVDFEAFTADGRWNASDRMPTLFHDEIPLDQWPDPDPTLPDLAVDTPVWVRSSPIYDWAARHFAKWEQDTICVYPDGRTSHTTPHDVLARFSQWSLTKPEEA